MSGGAAEAEAEAEAEEGRQAASPRPAYLDELVDPLPDSAYVAGYSSSDSDDGDSSDSSSSEGARGGSQRQQGAAPRQPADFTEVFTWVTIWIMIIFFIYRSESEYGHKLRRHARPLFILFSIPIGFLFLTAFYDAFVVQPRAQRLAAAREAKQKGSARGRKGRRGSGGGGGDGDVAGNGAAWRGEGQMRAGVMQRAAATAPEEDELWIN
jgi:hypothetical protein